MEEYNESIQDIFVILKRRLVARGFTVKDEFIYDEIYSAVGAVNSKRRFTPTSDVLFEPRYKDLIIRLCITSISKWGAEGESSHSENGISRSYESASEYPNSLLAEIIPLGKAR